MSDNLDEAEKWLPSELLTEEDIVMDSYGVLNSDIGKSNYFNSFSSSTGLTSPVDSIVTETKNYEDDLLRNALTILLSAQNNQKNGLVLPVSPLSTLPPVGIWSDRSNWLHKKNPITDFGGNDEVWALIQDAKMREENVSNRGSAFSRDLGFLGPHKSVSTPPPPKSTFFHGSHVLKQEDYGWSSSNMNLWNGSGFNGGRVGIKLNSYASPGLYVGVKDQQIGARGWLNLSNGYGFGSETRYGFGIGSDVRVGGLKNGRVGTGVFLPRAYGTKVSSMGSCANQGSSTWHQSKGFQTLKKNNPHGFAKVVSQPRFGGDITNDNDAFLARKTSRSSMQKDLPI